MLRTVELDRSDLCGPRSLALIFGALGGAEPNGAAPAEGTGAAAVLAAAPRCAVTRLSLGRAVLDDAAGAALAGSLSRGAALERLNFDNEPPQPSRVYWGADALEAVSTAAVHVGRALVAAGAAAQLRVRSLHRCRVDMEGAASRWMMITTPSAWTHHALPIRFGTTALIAHNKLSLP